MKLQKSETDFVVENVDISDIDFDKGFIQFIISVGIEYYAIELLYYDGNAGYILELGVNKIKGEKKI